MIAAPLVSGFPRLKFDPATVKVIADGNSFFAGGIYLPKIAALPPLSGQFTIANVAIGGQTFRKMNGLDTGSAEDIDALIVPGKSIVLLSCEGTNSIFDATNPRTAAQAASDAADWALARKARAAAVGVKLYIVMCTTIPRQLANSDSILWIYNQRLNDFNTTLKANYRAMGVDAVVDVRAGTRFDFVANTAASFASIADIMGNEFYLVHPNAAGYDILAAKWGPVLSRLPVR